MLLHSDPITDSLKALAEPRRREILRLVRSAEMTSGAIAEHFDVTGPAISQHLGVLLEAKLIAVRRAGTKRLYRAVPDRVEQVRAYLSAFWQTGLEALKTEAEAEERRRRDASAN